MSLAWKELKHRIGGGVKTVAPSLMLISGPKGSRRFALNAPAAAKMGITEKASLRVFLSEDKKYLGIAVDKAGSYSCKVSKYGVASLAFLTPLLAVEGLRPVSPPMAVAAIVPEDVDKNPVYAFDISLITEAV